MLWAMSGVLPAGQEQRPHRHQSVGLGNYRAALRSALDVFQDDAPFFGTLVLPDLVEAEAIGHLKACRARPRLARAHLVYGVLQGAFTLWNRQDAGEVTAELARISAGAAGRPVRNSGVFVGGQGDWAGQPRGGKVRVTRLSTGEIYADGGIAPNTPDLISGGVFVIYSGEVAEVVNEGPVTTYGPNDMVLDNWGSVSRWTARAPVTSRGPSGIGFVQFAELGTLRIEAPVETFGVGARSFNVYDGHLREASFASITTHADAGVGIQVSQPVERLRVDGDVRTSGGIGQSLVKGHVVPLPAYAVSIQHGGDAGSLSVGGSLITEGDDVITLQVQGRIGHIDVGGSVSAAGTGAEPVAVDGGTVDLSGITIASQAQAGGGSGRSRA